MKKTILLTFLVLTQTIVGQILKPGFDKEEYIETLKINHRTHFDLEKWDSIAIITEPEKYSFEYRSPRVAFDNLWDLWINKEKPVALISIRGSILTEASFLANLYAAMVPAQGEIQLDTNFLFRYKLADNPKAAVQVGWFIAMAYLSRTIEPKIDSLYQAGYKDFIITGHSQGGGIGFMLTAYLQHLKKDHKLPQDIWFKTYCSAGPKPGNLFFAYDYENITRGGWAFNVVNAADWVPDVPFSVQTVNDFTNVNPFSHARKMIKKQKFPNNLVLKHVYNQLSKPGIRAQKNYQKYLGKMVSRAVEKQMSNYKAPEYYKSNYFVRTGNTIVLYPDEEYYRQFDNSPDNTNIWMHHFTDAYMFLIERYK
ncbi:lipase family protein [Saccharicrinis sp. FJH2]|uniref:lipase family protein n=1 Tax=Saccharicrinis sp. FJH65 TaxID=3344659 RepID=UPI0035F3528B